MYFKYIWPVLFYIPVLIMFLLRRIIENYHDLFMN